MIKTNFLIFSAFFSVLVHFVFINFLQDKNNQREEVVVVDLSSYNEFKIPQKKSPPPQKIIKKKIKIEKPEDKPKEVVKKKIPIKESITLNKKKDAKEKIVDIDKPDKKILKEKKQTPKKEEKVQQKPKIKKNQTISVNKNSKKLINKELSKYLSFISSEINKLATKSYPIQSIRRREQGTIVAFITINSEGNLKEIEFDKKTPTRLFKATKKIIIGFNFPEPPTMILNKNKTIQIKIPVNFILQ